MKLNDLTRFQALAEKTGEPSADEKERLWEAVATLVRHLDDHLLIVDETTIPEGTACALTVFAARDAKATPLYVLANTEGVVTIGRADELSVKKSCQLAEFVPFRDEVVSLVVTRAHRLVGERLDLWLVVRRHSDESSATVAYHGLVWLGKDGQPELTPARDDENAGSVEWAPTPAENLPEWMLSRPMTFAPGLDPFVGPPQRLSSSEASAEVLAWATGTLCYATPEHLVLRRNDRRDEKTMPLRGKVAALAILDPTPDRTLIIAAYANRRVAGFAESEDGFIERWEQLLPGFPLALSLVPVTTGTASGSSEAWPDILLAVNAGLLRRRSYVGSKQIREVWGQCWERLGYRETDGGIRAAEEARTRAQAGREEATQRESTEMPVEQRREWLHSSGAAAGKAAEDQKRWLHGEAKGPTVPPKGDRWEAALVWAIEGVLQAAPTATPDERDRWLKQVSKLFRPPAPKRVLTAGILRLLRALREFAEGRETWPLLEQKGDFRPALVWRVYDRQSQAIDRERIDAVVRALDWSGNAGQDPNVERLRERSDRNREMVLHGPDPQDPTALIERTSIRIGCWASAYIPSDSLELAEPGSGSRRLLSLAYLRLEREWCLAISQGRELGLYELQKHGKLNPTPRYRHTRDGDLIQGLARVPAEARDRLLLVTRSGNALLLGVNSDGQGFQELARLGGGDCVSASAVAFYPGPPGQGVLAMACTEGRRSTLVTARIEADRFGIPSRLPLKLPRVASLDVSACGAEGFWVISGTGQLAPLYLARIDRGQVTEPRPLQVLKGGASALCFETDKDPDYVLAGDYGGMLRCLRLTPPAAAGELHWTYQLKGAIRAIARLKHDKKTHFLVASEQCELCLLRAEDGTRVWKCRTWEPIRRVAVADSPGLAAVGMTRGMIVVFKQLEEKERRSSFRRVIKRHLIWLKDNFPLERADSAWNHPDADWVKAIYEIEIARRDPAPLLKEFEDRETRARIVRYAAQEHGVESTGMARDIVQALRFRELALLLSYLPEQEASPWLEPVYHALAERRWGAGDDSPRAAMAACAVFIQCLSRRQPGIDTLIRHLPPAQYLEKFPWVRMEYLRGLAESVRKDHKGMESLLPVLLSHLLRLPPELLIRPETVFPHGSEPERDLDALAELLIRLEGTERSIGEALSRVAERLARLSKGKGWLAFLYSLLTLCFCYSKNAGKEWRTWRAEALAALRSFAEHSHAYDTTHATEAPVVEALRALLPRKPMPEDRDRLETRRDWIEVAWRRAEGNKDPASEAIRRLNASWQPYLAGLFRYMRETVQFVLRAELSHVEQHVRPRLMLQKCTREEGNRVRLWVQTQPEGWRQLDDVTLVFDARADPSEGLFPSRDGGGAVISVHPVSYPGPFGAQDLELWGYVRPEQKTVKIRVTVQAAGPYALEETWAFDIPPAPGPAPTGLSLPESLAWLSDKFFTKIEHTADRCALGVYDEELGRSRFLHDWDVKHPGQRVDLDAATRDIGAGRAYAARALDLTCIEAPIRDALARAGDVGRGVPLLVGPVDELFQRLLEGEAPGVLESWWSGLRKRAQSGTGHRQCLIVSSRVACRLRGLSFTGIKEIAAHRMVLRELQVLERTASPMWSDLLHLVCKRLGVCGDAEEQEAEGWIERLGADLRLVLGWLRWADEKAGRFDPNDYLEQEKVQDRLRLELGSLPALDLIHALLGAMAETSIARRDVRPGHVAAEDCYSTTHRHEPKLLQKRGSAFTADSLNRIDSDRHAPGRLIRLEGLGPKGTPEVRASRLLDVVHRWPTSRRQTSFECLAAYGIGAWEEGIFRTGSPYRELIRGLYDKFRDDDAPDTSVYQALVGGDRWLIEAVPPEELGRWPRADLKVLMPGAGDDDLRRLGQLARTWSGEGQAQPLAVALSAVLSSLFAPARVWQMDNAPGRWDRPLLALGLACFGVSSHPPAGHAAEPLVDYPERYVLWAGSDASVETPEIGRAVDRAIDASKRQRDRREGERASPGPVLVLGPGAEGLALDPDRRVAVLRLVDCRDAACRGEPGSGLGPGLWRKARVQLNLLSFSPFQTSGPLPPGSPLFRGRDEELGFIRARARKASILIVGSRRLGKTSLLNQVYHWARGEPDLAPILVDLQGVETEQGFLSALQRALCDPALTGVEAALHTRYAAGEDALRAMSNAARGERRLALFLFNEIDALVEQDSKQVAAWRGMHEQPLARFVMVAYTSIGWLGRPEGPLFHFTEGPHFGGKALVLGGLSEPAATGLLDLLEDPALGLRWRSAKERTAGYGALLERSYRIPWVLQRYGELLVLHMEKRRSEVLSHDDVQRVLQREGEVVWKYIEEIDYRSLGHHGSPEALRLGFHLVLYALARHKYFLGGERAPILQPGLRGKDSSAFSFTVAEARDVVEKTLGEILQGAQLSTFVQWFAGLELERAFRLLTLTLALEPDPGEHDRYGFLLHILPLELARRHARSDPELTGLILDLAAQLERTVDRRLRGP